MSDIFPKWSSRLPQQMAVAFVALLASIVAGAWYYFTPKYTSLGYQPIQPVSFSHATHVEQLGMDCRYCHVGVEAAWYANLPASGSCMNCHNQVLKDDPRLSLVRQSAQSGQPIPWVHIHRLADYVYFNHAVHVSRGVSCVHCHGNVHLMDEVGQAQPLSMVFCLSCHRNPAAVLRPPAEVYNLDWKASNLTQQLSNGARYVSEWNVQKLDNCSACHR